MIPHDLNAEEAIVGGILMAGTIPPDVLDTGLTDAHFYRHGNVFRLAVKLHDDGTRIDTITLPEAKDAAGPVPDLGNLPTYARRIVDKARWRDRRQAGHLLMEAAAGENEEQVALAERMLLAPAEHAQVYVKERLQDLAWRGVDKPEPPGWRMPFFKKRLKRGTLHLWGGWTSHGKSVWVDQIARELDEQGANVWAWLNEMTAKERMDRLVSAKTGIALDRIEAGLLTTGDEYGAVLKALENIPFQIVECPGWTAEAICRDIRIRRPDVAVVDILHNVPYRDERDLASICLTFANTAKLADCCIIATVHLNRSGIVGAARPHPVMHHIKGASAFEQIADLVGMVWRQDDETTGRPQANGQLYTLKVRQGSPEGYPVLLDGPHATFNADLTYAA